VRPAWTTDPQRRTGRQGPIRATYGHSVLPAWTAAAALISGAAAVHDAVPGAAECYYRGRPAVRRRACDANTPILVAWTLRATSVDPAQGSVAARHPATPGALFTHRVLPAWTPCNGGGLLACPGAGATSVDSIRAATNCSPCIPACYHCGRLMPLAARPPGVTLCYQRGPRRRAHPDHGECAMKRSIGGRERGPWTVCATSVDSSAEHILLARHLSALVAALCECDSARCSR
jgi:hypothetical protein